MPHDGARSKGKGVVGLDTMEGVGGVFKGGLVDCFDELHQEKHDNAVIKHLGCCDIAMIEIIDALSLRLTIQILMLLLTNRTVVLLGRSITCISDMLLTLPRLVWPFRLHRTHHFEHLLSHGALLDWIHLHCVHQQAGVVNHSTKDRANTLRGLYSKKHDNSILRLPPNMHLISSRQSSKDTRDGSRGDIGLGVVVVNSSSSSCSSIDIDIISIVI